MNDIVVENLHLQDYESCFANMRDFTKSRDDEAKDKIWLLEHNPVFTLGQAGKREHILQSSDIPIIQTDRGGQVTYHGPGQIVVYFLINLRRRKIGIKAFVCGIEKAVIEFLDKEHGIKAHLKEGAPGVYVDGAKICSIGLRISKGCSYHGISFNFAMDLTPFSYINPCGYKGLAITQVKDLSDKFENIEAEKERLLPYLLNSL